MSRNIIYSVYCLIDEKRVINCTPESAPIFTAPCHPGEETELVIHGIEEEVI